MSVRPILASLCLTLLLAACGTLTPAPAPTPPATSTPAPTVTPTFDPAPLLQANPYPGTDLGLQPEAAYTLPDEVQAKLREMGAIPILANGRAGSVKDGQCRLAMPEQLVSGAQVNTEAAAGGTAPFTLPDGQVDQSGIWQLPVADDWQCVAFVAGLGNQLGLEPGTVGVWFFSGGGKGGVEILNPDNPLRVFFKSPNRVDVRLDKDGRLAFNTLGPDGKVIEEQAVVFPAPIDPVEAQLRGMSGVVVPEDLFVDPKTGRDMLTITSPEMAQYWYEEILKGLWQANKAYEAGLKEYREPDADTIVDTYKTPEAFVAACKRGDKISNLWLPMRLVGRTADRGSTMKIFNITMFRVEEEVDLSQISLSVLGEEQFRAVEGYEQGAFSTIALNGTAAAMFAVKEGRLLIRIGSLEKQAGKHYAALGNPGDLDQATTALYANKAIVALKQSLIGVKFGALRIGTKDNYTWRMMGRSIENWDPETDFETIALFK